MAGPAGVTAHETAAAAAGAPASRSSAARRLLPGFGAEIVEERLVNGRRVGRTRGGAWLDLAGLVAAPVSSWQGVALAPGQAGTFGWVVRDQAPVLRGGTVLARKRRLARVDIAGRCARDVCTLAGGEVMRRTDLAVPHLSPRPAGTGPTERWLDVDIESQTLTAYEGDRPVFATLVSTGIGRPGSPLATSVGTFRIRAKRRFATMDNLEHTSVVPYRYEDIPHVQIFSRATADSAPLDKAWTLHAALWHHRFGLPASHGCINLAPRDAERLFAFTSPAVAATAEEAIAATPEAGTVIRIRDGADDRRQ